MRQCFGKVNKANRGYFKTSVTRFFFSKRDWTTPPFFVLFNTLCHGPLLCGKACGFVMLGASLVNRYIWFVRVPVGTGGCSGTTANNKFPSFTLSATFAMSHAYGVV
jgi:hypothetical protein